MADNTTHRVTILLSADDMGKLRAMSSKDERTHTATLRILIREAFAARAKAMGRTVPEH